MQNTSRSAKQMATVDECLEYQMPNADNQSSIPVQSLHGKQHTTNLCVSTDSAARSAVSNSNTARTPPHSNSRALLRSELATKFANAAVEFSSTSRSSEPRMETRPSTALLWLQLHSQSGSQAVSHTIENGQSEVAIGR